MKKGCKERREEKGSNEGRKQGLKEGRKGGISMERRYQDSGNSSFVLTPYY